MPLWGRWLLVAAYVVTALIVFNMGKQAGYQEAACEMVKEMRSIALASGNSTGWMLSASKEEEACG